MTGDREKVQDAVRSAEDALQQAQVLCVRNSRNEADAKASLAHAADPGEKKAAKANLDKVRSLLDEGEGIELNARKDLERASAALKQFDDECSVKFKADMAGIEASERAELVIAAKHVVRGLLYICAGLERVHTATTTGRDPSRKGIGFHQKIKTLVIASREIDTFYGSKILAVISEKEFDAELAEVLRALGPFDKLRDARVALAKRKRALIERKGQ